MKELYFWIIGGGVLQIPLIEEAKKIGLKVIVTDANPNCVCAKVADIFNAIDIFDIDNHISFANSLITNGTIIKGVLAAGIDAPETMTRIAEHIGIPGVSSKIAHLVNHKELFRKKMRELDIPVPNYYVVTRDNLDQLEKIVSEIEYPLIVKNTSSSGSRGTKIFYDPDIEGVKETIFEAIEVSRSSKALIESLWIGSEHTVETIFDVNGKFHECFITDRNFDKSDGYALETGLVHPSQLPKKNQKEMYILAEKVSKSIGITNGAAKFDMIMTKEGPRIIEMTVRLSGGFDCQYLVPFATGKNILKAAIHTAIGESFDSKILLDKKNRVCLSESLWPSPGKIISIEGLDKIKSMSGFEYIYFRYNVGDFVEPYTDCTKRVCFIIVSGINYNDALNNMNKIKEKINIKISKEAK